MGFGCGTVHFSEICIQKFTYIAQLPKSNIQICRPRNYEKSSKIFGISNPGNVELTDFRDERLLELNTLEPKDNKCLGMVICILAAIGGQAKTEIQLFLGGQP